MTRSAIFTGKERDAESGLDYFGARYYSSSMGRFSSPDPKATSAHLENPQSWNRYAYTDNNPLVYIDPDGKEKLKIVMVTYIPGDRVTAPITGRTFNANGNGQGENGLNFKSRQFVLVETDKAISVNPQVDAKGRAGTTVQYNSDGSVKAVAQDPDSTVQQGATRNQDGSVNVNFTGDLANPLQPGAPAIDFNVNVTCSGGTCSASSGGHDGFPAYRIEVTNEAGQTTQIYNYDPNKAGKGPGSLFPPMDCKVPSGGSCGAGQSTGAPQK